MTSPLPSRVSEMMHIATRVTDPRISEKIMVDLICYNGFLSFDHLDLTRRRLISQKMSNQIFRSHR